MKNRAAVFPENDLFLPAQQATTPPPQDAGGFTRGIGAIPLVPGESREAASVPVWWLTTFFIILKDIFLGMTSSASLLDRLTGSSDCASERKALIADGSPSKVGPEPSTCLSDEMLCVPCGRKTRDWILATYSNGECVCRDCWPEYARVRFRSKIPAPVAKVVGGGGKAACTGTPYRRRYILNHHE